ncbi:MAG: DNA (cytosine-5-)-methyltransferase [Betaproteobacteria bacterium]
MNHKHHATVQSCTYKLIDLFAGIGGIRAAFENTGNFKTVLSSEIDRHARETYKANFGDEPAGDIRKIIAKMFTEAAADVVVGGTPCQAFSQIGRRLGFDDVRGTLFYEFLRVVRAVAPKAFLMENVEALPSHDGGRTFETMLDLFDRTGYNVQWKVLDAREFGLPQKRRRVFVVGIRKDIFTTFEFPKGNSKTARFGDILEPKVAPKYLLSAKYRRGLEARTARNAFKGNGFGMAIPDLDGAANTITVGGSGRERNLVRVGENGLRRLTPREFARLQGFPDSFVIPVSDTQAYKQFGNSVPVPVVQAIATNLAMALANASSLLMAA